MGDALWALMVFFIFGFLFNKKSVMVIALLAIGFAFAKPVLRWYLAMQKRHSAQEKAQAKENGAAPKEHDTADRTPSGDGADHITT